MKTKCFVLLALMLCVGAFLFPTTAYASNSENPVVTAAVEGEVLRIEASGGILGVEAIFINGERYNFRVDGVLSVDLLAFRDSEAISVYAVDFAGNISNIVSIANPQYIGLETQQPDPAQGIPVTPSPSNPFTPEGQASVLDNANTDDEKEFFTFTTPAGNVFFLIVDRQRGSDNVYFLNAVTEQDLIALAEQSGQEISGSGGIPVSTAPQTPIEQQPEEQEPTEPDPPAPDTGGGNGTLIFMLVAVAIAGAAGYYFKIVRPKQQSTGDYDDEDEDEDDIGEDMEFEDDPGDSVEDEDGNHDDDYYNTDDSEDEPEVEDDGL